MTRKNLFWKKAREKKTLTEEEQIRKELEEKEVYNSPNGETFFLIQRQIYVIPTDLFHKVFHRIEANHPEYKNLSYAEKISLILPHITWHSRKLSELEEGSNLEITLVYDGLFAKAWKIVDKTPIEEHEIITLGEPYGKRPTLGRMKPIEEPKKEDWITREVKKVFRKFGWKID